MIVKIIVAVQFHTKFFFLRTHLFICLCRIFLLIFSFRLLRITSQFIYINNRKLILIIFIWSFLFCLFIIFTFLIFRLSLFRIGRENWFFIQWFFLHSLTLIPFLFNQFVGTIFLICSSRQYTITMGWLLLCEFTFNWIIGFLWRSLPFITFNKIHQSKGIFALIKTADIFVFVGWFCWRLMLCWNTFSDLLIKEFNKWICFTVLYAIFELFTLLTFRF